MWVIFLFVVLSLIVVGLGVWYLGNKVHLRIQKENRKFELENKTLNETKENECK